MDTRLEEVRKAIREEGFEAVIISSPENRRYLSGFTGSSALLLISLDKAYLVTDFRYLEQASKQADKFEIVKPLGTPDDTITDLIKNEGFIKLGFEAGDLTYSQYESYQERFEGVNLIPSKELVENLRRIKDADEIGLIRKAVDIADKAFDHIIDFMRPGIKEQDIANELEYFMKKNGAEKSAFDIIVASGHRAALPHGVASEKELAYGDFVVLDFGAVFKGYHSDMTRTVVIGKATEEQKKIYNIVLEAQLNSTAKIEPGQICSSIDMVARKYITREGYGEKFGHGLGHSVGLAIHEKPSFSPRDSTVLKEGMVLTVEPGIYINGWGGVRIEDIVLVTSEGREVLTQSTKKLLEL